MQEGDYFLKKQKILNAPKDLDSEEVYANLKQKTNRKLFGLIRFNLQMYNLPDPDKIPEKTAKKIASLEKRNAEREGKGKDRKEIRARCILVAKRSGRSPSLIGLYRDRQLQKGIEQILCR